MTDHTQTEKPKGPGEGDDMAYDVLRALRRILIRITRYSRQVARASGLTVPQILCMRAIDETQRDGNEATVIGVSRRVHLTPSTVSRILDRLEDGGLIKRQRGTEDRRKVFLVLTPRGIERVKVLPTPLQHEFLRRFAALSDSDRRGLLNALQRTVEMMDAEEVEAAPLLSAEEDVRVDGSEHS